MMEKSSPGRLNCSAQRPSVLTCTVLSPVSGLTVLMMSEYLELDLAVS